jgi:hypothetical protein
MRSMTRSRDAAEGRRLRPWILAAVVALTTVRIALLIHAVWDVSPSGYGLGNNARRYHDIATIEGTPYRDAAVEVPPVALAAIELLDDGDTRALARRMAVAMFACDVAIALALWWAWGRRNSLLYWAIGTPLAYHVYLRIDLLAVLLAVIAIALVRRQRQLGAAVPLAAGVFVKLWPVALLPSLVASGRRRALVASAAAIVLGGLAWLAWVGPDGPRQVVTLRNATGWEFQTPWGLVLWQVRGFLPRLQSGALRVGTIDPWVRAALATAWFAIALWTTARTRHRPDVADGAGATVTVGSLLLLSPLFSDQFVSWLVPWVAAMDDDRGSIWATIATTAAAGAVALSGSRLGDDATVVAALLALRNAAVLVVTVAAIVVVARTPRRRPRWVTSSTR